MLDNFDHIKAYWIMISPRIAPVRALLRSRRSRRHDRRGEDRPHGGATTPVGLTIDELVRLVREAGRIPLQRDSVYNIVRTFENSVAVA
jgi:aminodeoxyfutalosine synthase